MTLTLIENNKLKYQLFVKETDARFYLNTDSFDPAHVFKSVVFSQMMRVIQRNSNDSTCVEDLARLKQDMIKSGHSEDVIEEIEPLAVQRAIENYLYNHDTPKEPTEQVVFSVMLTYRNHRSVVAEGAKLAFLFDGNDVIVANCMAVSLDFRLTCKDNIIYLAAQCQLCNTLTPVLARTPVSAMHTRMNGYRNKFIIDSPGQSVIIRKISLVNALLFGS